MSRVLRGSLIALVLAAWVVVATAQPGAVKYRVGLLSSGGRITETSDAGKAISHGLVQRGYVLGQNLTVESRGADGKAERLPGLVRELIAANVGVIYTMGYPAALAAVGAPDAVPVVALGTGDPVATGLAVSLAHPGGNVTGISDVAAALAPKRLALLKEAIPSLKRVAMLWNASDLGMQMRYDATSAFAQSLGIHVISLGVRAPDDFKAAFAAMTLDPPDALFMVSDNLTRANRASVIDYAAAHALPAIYELDFYVNDGGLMSYGPDLDEVYDRAVVMIDRILKGAKPADLPFEQPVHYKLAINLKTARALGITIPGSLLAQADEVIE